MIQADIVRNYEADAWLERNRDRLGAVDPVTGMLVKQNIRPERVIEIGCSNGWRLAKLRDRFKCAVYGIEPGRRAAMEAREARISVKRATAESLPMLSNSCDLLIYGFCLYLADPGDWLRIAAEGDRVLQPGGYLVIHDFAPVDLPFARPYQHRPDLVAYHYDFSRLWRGNPLYVPIDSVVEGSEAVILLQKEPIDSIAVEIKR